MRNLLSRQAEAIFWMARQIERANNTARILDITASFSRDGDDIQPWAAVLELFSDTERFLKHYEDITASNVLFFYMSDERNPNAVCSNVAYARDNARALRPLLSTELWTQLNVFNNAMQDVKRADLRDEKVSDLCARIVQACQTHIGLVDETMMRDEEWYFYAIGHNLERADQTTRLVDVKYHNLLPKDADVGSQVDIAQWNVVLRSAAGFQSYRRMHHRGLTSKKVSSFLLLDKRFPRSVRHTTAQACKHLEEMIDLYDFRSGAKPLALLVDLREQARDTNIDTIIQDGMHQWIDDVQCDITQITAALGDAFFGNDA